MVYFKKLKLKKKIFCFFFFLKNIINQIPIQKKKKIINQIKFISGLKKKKKKKKTLY